MLWLVLAIMFWFVTDTILSWLEFPKIVAPGVYSLLSPATSQATFAFYNPDTSHMARAQICKNILLQWMKAHAFTTVEWLLRNRSDPKFKKLLCQ